MTLTGIPTGLSCSVTEDPITGWSTSVSPASVTIGEGEGPAW